MSLEFISDFHLQVNPVLGVLIAYFDSLSEAQYLLVGRAL